MADAIANRQPEAPAVAAAVSPAENYGAIVDTEAAQQNGAVMGSDKEVTNEDMPDTPALTNDAAPANAQNEGEKPTVDTDSEEDAPEPVRIVRQVCRFFLSI